MRRIAVVSTLGVILALGLMTGGCKKKKKAADKVASSKAAKSPEADKAKKKLQAIAAKCKTEKKGIGNIGWCKAWESYRKNKKAFFEGVKPGNKKAKRLKAMMAAATALVKSGTPTEKAVSATFIAKGLYTMTWAKMGGRDIYRQVLADAYGEAKGAKFRKRYIEILSNDGGTSGFHGNAKIAKLIIKAAGSDADDTVRRAALDAVKYKVHQKVKPTVAQINAWFNKEKPSSINQITVIEIAGRLKLKKEVGELCTKYEAKLGKKTSTCTSLRKELGIEEPK